MKSVWVVDDDTEMNRAVQLMLQLLGFEARTFPAARPAALELLSGKRPDLMILDINMPEVSGLEFLDFIRHRKEFKDMPVVMLSSEATDILVDRSLQKGADAYLIKPATLDDLEQAMQKAFRAHGMNP